MAKSKTRNIIAEIAGFFDETEKAKQLLWSCAVYSTKEINPVTGVVKGFNAEDGSFYHGDFFYEEQKKMYDKRVKTGTPHSISVLENMLLGSYLGSTDYQKGRVGAHPTLDILDRHMK